MPNGTSGSVGLPTSSNADSLTDNGLPVRKLEKLGAASASDDISGARPGYIYLENFGPGRGYKRDAAMGRNKHLIASSGGYA